MQRKNENNSSLPTFKLNGVTIHPDLDIQLGPISMESSETHVSHSNHDHFFISKKVISLNQLIKLCSLRNEAKKLVKEVLSDDLDLAQSFNIRIENTNSIENRRIPEKYENAVKELKKMITTLQEKRTASENVILRKMTL